MHRQSFSTFFFSAFVLGVFSFPVFLNAEITSNSENRPNVIVFLSDDQGYGDFSYTGNRDLVTPNIDGLARDGAFVEQFFVCPVCSPTRAEFLTGRYHPRGGVFSTGAGGERLDLDESTIAQAFQSAGYATAAFGKWHNGMQAPYHPNSRGFDEYYGFCSGHWGNYFDPILDHNGQIVRGKGFIVDDFTDHAIEFIENHQTKPFFIYLPYNTPHSPMQVPDKYWNKFKDKPLTQMPGTPNAKVKKGKGIDHARAALAMCENIDHNVGRVLEKLDELKLADNTIVLYFCDNGPNGARYNAGLKGRKGSTDEGGVRSPLFVRWPGVIPAGNKVNLVTGAIDLWPTLTSLCGIPLHDQKDHPLDGISFDLELRGAKVKRKPRYLFNAWRGKVSVRTQQYRLDNKGVLYNVMNDPGQQTPVNDRPKIKQELQAAVDQWKSTVLAELVEEQRVFPVGHRSMERTQLPARDAEVTGAIERSNKFPNCSYFGHWVNSDDTISWPVEVMESGKFRVEVYYCLAQENVGAELQLSMGSHQVTKVVDEANDPPALGAENDRSVRGESLVKDFQVLDMGVIELDQGNGRIELRTVKMPGKESIEFRLLMLTRVE
ncbi:MAG: arylsulfatase [Mariniblastus sp.]|nr:arylsulfatase [Mariniblastus sp.]